MGKHKCQSYLQNLRPAIPKKKLSLKFTLKSSRMGEIIKAICGCGYQSKELKFGAGMEDFEHSRTVPAISMTTAEIVELDILAKSPILNWYPILIPNYMTRTVPALPCRYLTHFCPPQAITARDVISSGWGLNLWDFMTNIKGAPRSHCYRPIVSWSHKLKQKPALGVTFYCYTKCRSEEHTSE